MDMKVIVKEPGKKARVAEVSDIREINQLCGNLDEKGLPLSVATSDTRGPIGEDVDMYCNEKSAVNADLGANLWGPNNGAMYCGTLVFAGYNGNVNENFGAVSLNDKQTKFVLEFIKKQQD
jgi:hypothetical protein